MVFTSDNGPWLMFNLLGGSAGLLREGKGCTYEGGMREPCITWWPGTIQPAVIREMGCTMDLFTTMVKLAGGEVPSDRIIDGLDLSPVLFARGPSPRNTVFYYRGVRLHAVRKGSFKAHFITQSGYGTDKPETHDPPLLYNLDHDPSEQFDVAKYHPKIIADIQKEVAEHQRTLVPGEDQLAGRVEKS